MVMNDIEISFKVGGAINSSTSQRETYACDLTIIDYLERCSTESTRDVHGRETNMLKCSQ